MEARLTIAFFFARFPGDKFLRRAYEIKPRDRQKVKLKIGDPDNFITFGNLFPLKVLVTISMLILLIYNSVGYYFIFKIQHQKAEEEFNEYLNNSEYTDSDLTLFKVPISEYSTEGGKDFSRVEGDFEHKGRFYEIVKQRIENDTIYNYCLNNEKVEALYAQLYDHINTHLVDGKAAKSKKSDNPAAKLLKEYLPKSPNHLNLSFHSFAKGQKYSELIINYTSQNLTIFTPPPEVI